MKGWMQQVTQAEETVHGDSCHMKKLECWRAESKPGGEEDLGWGWGRAVVHNGWRDRGRSKALELRATKESDYSETGNHG